jgi:carboxyl-terminal processing protease
LAVTAAWGLLTAAQAAAPKPTEAEYRQDALSIEGLINDNYAYRDRLPGGRLIIPDVLKTEASHVGDGRALLHYAEEVLTLLADHHAITGSSFSDSWAVVPTYSDLWIEAKGQDFVITAVRDGSPAQAAGVKVGDRLTAVGNASTRAAIDGFWRDLGTTSTPVRDDYAARVLAAGRRDGPRHLTLQTPGQASRTLTLDNLYLHQPVDQPPVTVSQQGRDMVIRFNNSLGDDPTVAAFDAAMALAKPGQGIILDLRDTPSGGNTTIARAVMGWFVDKPTGYQVHNLPAEERQTGIPRQWIEEVLPREGKRHKGRVTVLVGRWTGSMGEGLAIGFDNLGAKVVGDRMAGLLGAVDDYPLAHDGLSLKLPTERLYTIAGVPREAFVPKNR